MKDRKLSKAKRREEILLELRLRPHVRSQDLARRFEVSAETIRRDVEALSRKGLVGRAHGGATAAGGGTYPGFDERMTERQSERELIGRKAAELVEPGMVLMVDSGATTLQFARFLTFVSTPCTVITNSLSIAMTLGNCPDIKVLLGPGLYMATEAAAVGPELVEFIGRYRADLCLVGASGLCIEGPMEEIREFSSIKAKMIERSAGCQLLIDCEKFGRSALVRFASLQQLSGVICEQAPEGDLAKALQDTGVTVSVAENKEAG